VRAWAEGKGQKAEPLGFCGLPHAAASVRLVRSTTTAVGTVDAPDNTVERHWGALAR
jgi:hypothetical protein